jgi:hypothetical protein
MVLNPPFYVLRLIRMKKSYGEAFQAMRSLDFLLPFIAIILLLLLIKFIMITYFY